MRARLRTLFLPALLTCLALFLLVSLGNWQVDRLTWKQDLVARVQVRPTLPPLDLRDRGVADLREPSVFVQQNEYRPILLTGEYAADGEVLVFTSLTGPHRPFGGPGYWVLTPFVTPRSNWTVFVNRGFVPDGREHAYAAPPTGEQTIKGLVRAPETGSWFTPEPKLDERVFFMRDPKKIAAAIGLADAAGGFFIDLDASYAPRSGLPQTAETRLSFANNHLQYAITWYGLAAALLAVFGVFVWRRLKEPQDERLTPPGQRP